MLGEPGRELGVGRVVALLERCLGCVGAAALDGERAARLGRFGLGCVGALGLRSEVTLERRDGLGGLGVHLVGDPSDLYLSHGGHSGVGWGYVAAARVGPETHLGPLPPGALR